MATACSDDFLSSGEQELIDQPSLGAAQRIGADTHRQHEQNAGDSILGGSASIGALWPVALESAEKSGATLTSLNAPAGLKRAVSDLESDFWWEYLLAAPLNLQAHQPWRMPTSWQEKLLTLRTATTCLRSTQRVPVRGKGGRFRSPPG